MSVRNGLSNLCSGSWFIDTVRAGFHQENLFQSGRRLQAARDRFADAKVGGQKNTSSLWKSRQAFSLST